jgi:hypothetical protein
LVTLGDRIAPGAAIVRLGRAAGVKVVAGIEPSDAADLQKGQEVEATPLLGKGAPFSGTIVGVSGMLNPVTRMVDVTVALEAGKGGLPGTPVKASIVTEDHPGLVVPRQAVLEDDDGIYLFQVKAGKAVRVPVEKGIETDSETEVSGAALAKDLPVVLLGNYELTDGMAVTVETPKENAK